MTLRKASLALATVFGALAGTSVMDSVSAQGGPVDRGAVGYFPRRAQLELLMRSARLRAAQPNPSPTRGRGLRGMGRGRVMRGMGGGRMNGGMGRR
jgi:hypothetical protein